MEKSDMSFIFEKEPFGMILNQAANFNGAWYMLGFVECKVVQFQALEGKSRTDPAEDGVHVIDCLNVFVLDEKLRHSNNLPRKCGEKYV